MLALKAGAVASLAYLVAWISLGYLTFALVCILRHRWRQSGLSQPQPPLSVLKPLNGLDAQLYENLSSFCAQDYPSFQIVFSVASPGDPAVPVVERVMREHPELDLSLVIDARAIGTNRKISNVANGYQAAKHDVLIIADSDMRVESDYLARIAAAFDSPLVGAVTCLYSATTLNGLASRLASMFINDSFLPSVLVALRLQELKFCFGATMAVRRDALQRIGGFAALGSILADDYMLGQLVSVHGYQVRLASCVVRNIVQENSLRELWLHELRWARTVRTVRPFGYALSIMTQALPVTAALWLLTSSGSSALLLGAAAALRVALHYLIRARFQIPGHTAPWLIPLRDALSFGIWAASFFGRDVRWQGGTFTIQADGEMRTRGDLPA